MKKGGGAVGAKLSAFHRFTRFTNPPRAPAQPFGVCAGEG
jgi:hypothetical protein